MGGKGSAPAAPDYVGAAQLQGEISQENLESQNYANRPTQNTPFGSTTWTTTPVVDPSSGNTVTSWTQNTTLTPELTSALNDQLNLQSDRSSLASDFMTRVQNEYSTPFDWSNLPQRASLTGPTTLNTQLADYTPGLRTNVPTRTDQMISGFQMDGPQMSVNAMQGDIQRSLNTRDNPALPQFDSSYRDSVASSMMERMSPVHSRQLADLETKLASQGFNVGSEGYTRAMADLQQRQAAERFNALDMAGNEAQRLFNMGMGSRQQAFNEDLAGGQFGNQATGQAFQQGMGAAQFGNQAQNQLYGQRMGQANLANQVAGQRFNQDLSANQFNNQALGQAAALDTNRMNAMNSALSSQQGLNMDYANFQNNLRQQAIAEQMQRRGMSLNEMNALLTGQQVGMPQMPSFNAAGRAETPNILGATGMSYDAALGAYNAQQAGNANVLGGLFSLGGAALSNPFMFSDRRLKRNIKRIGTHSTGIGIYEYTMLGYPQVGVMAQELQAVRPDLVKRHQNGYLMVNYGGL